MRWTAVVCAAGLAPLAGCNLAYYAGHNLVNEPVTRCDEHKLDARLRAEAEACWLEVCRQYPARTFTAEFADGFVEGFVDYLDSGGTPQPPAVPPIRYRRSQYLTPQGHERAKDYLIGFKYGSEVACQTGRRQFLTVPVVLTEPRPEAPLNIARIPPPPETGETPGATPVAPLPTPLAAPKPPNLGNPVPPKPDEGAIPPKLEVKPSVIPPVEVPKAPMSVVDPPIVVPSAKITVDIDPHRNLPAVRPPVAERPAAMPPLEAPPRPLPAAGL